MQLYRAVCTITAAFAVAVSSLSCSTTKEEEASPEEVAAPVPVDPRGEITKIKYFHLQAGKDYFAADPAIPFERNYRLHGAITSEERRARYGHYYTIFWKARERVAPMTVRFEYRQKLTGPAVKVIEQAVDNVRRKNQTDLEVTGDPYWTDGSVTSWRVSLLRDGEVVDSDQSYLWK